MGWNHDLQSTEDCSREQHQTTADSCGYEACYERIPLTTQAVVGLDACGKNMLHYSVTGIGMTVVELVLVILWYD